MDEPDGRNLMEICILITEYSCFREYAPGGPR